MKKLFSKIHRENLSKALKGNRNCVGRIGNNGNSGFLKGHGKLGDSMGSTGKHWKKTPEQLENSRLVNLGVKNPNWKGGKTPDKIKIRMSKEYEVWRRRVFERDRYTCTSCGEVGGLLNADHIKSFAQYPELRTDISNGRTLCVSCHKLTDTFAGRSNRIQNNPNLFQRQVS
jgi:hypothetical protein